MERLREQLGASVSKRIHEEQLDRVCYFFGYHCISFTPSLQIKADSASKIKSANSEASRSNAEREVCQSHITGIFHSFHASMPQSLAIRLKDTQSALHDSSTALSRCLQEVRMMAKSVAFNYWGL